MHVRSKSSGATLPSHPASARFATTGSGASSSYIEHKFVASDSFCAFAVTSVVIARSKTFTPPARSPTYARATARLFAASGSLGETRSASSKCFFPVAYSFVANASSPASMALCARV